MLSYIYINPKILIYAWFSHFVPVKCFILTFYKSYRKMHKTEENDFKFHYSGTFLEGKRYGMYFFFCIVFCGLLLKYVCVIPTL